MGAVVVLWYLDLQLPMQSVPIKLRVQIALMQPYVITFVSNLRQVGGFLRVLRFPSPTKLMLHYN